MILAGVKEDGEALGTFLKRRQYWEQLKGVVNAKNNEFLKPYSFRLRYAKRSHATGFPIANFAYAIGQTFAVRRQNHGKVYSRRYG